MDSTAVCNKINSLLKKRIYEEDNECNDEILKKARVDIFNDREQFYKRVKTFKANNDITEIICATLFALKGWYYSAASTNMPMVTCVTCHESFSVRFDKTKGVTDYRLKEQYLMIDQKRKEQILDNLFSKHKTLCPWKDIQSSASLLEIPIYLDSSAAKEMFVSRCQQYCDQFSENLPLVKPIQSQLSSDTMNMLLSKYQIRVNALPRSKINSILLLTLYGWRIGCIKSSMESLQCDTCDRTLGIWNYLSLNFTDSSMENEVAAEYDDESSCSKRVRLTADFKDDWLVSEGQTLSSTSQWRQNSTRCIFGGGLPSDSEDDEEPDFGTKRITLFGKLICRGRQYIGGGGDQTFSFFQDDVMMSNSLASRSAINYNDMRNDKLLRKRVHKKIVKKCLIPQNEHISWCPWSKPRSFNQFLLLLLGPHYQLSNNTDSMASRTIDIIKNM